MAKMFDNGKYKKDATNKIRSSCPKGFWNNMPVDISQNSQESTSARIKKNNNKVAGLRPAVLLKKDSGRGVFLWILWSL